VIHVLGLEVDEEHNGEVRFQISLFLKKLQAFTGWPYWIQVEHFKWEGGNVVHVLGLEVDEEHNGEVRFQISLFLKKLQAFTSSIL
jgi:predicted secreted protein